MPHVSFIPAGRAGNFLFECAAAFGYAKKHRLQFSVPKRTSNEFWSPIYLNHLQNPNYNEGIETIMVYEKNFHYDELPFDESWRSKNITLQGYFQSFKYFDEYRQEMLNTFDIPYKIISDTCSIHARYGDYLTITGKHIIIDEDYLTKAMTLITEKTEIIKFKVFSDDLPLFKERHGKLYDFEYSENNDIIKDLIEMSCMHSNIGSSSTFSWWAQYLNRNPEKVVITQRNWFQGGWKENTLPVYTHDLLPESWIKI